jgi:hypothetical protein
LYFVLQDGAEDVEDSDDEELPDLEATDKK